MGVGTEGGERWGVRAAGMGEPLPEVGVGALLGLGLSPSPSLSSCFRLSPSNPVPHGRPKLSTHS